ncbi:MAG: tRNA dihydrouridine synthase DusB [Eubacteriales bacterium]|nr:tRNA dihydrouridine synthase DusB [Eubacteriales bacterium]
MSEQLLPTGAGQLRFRRPWSIGSVLIDNPFVLAPMAGVGDMPYRLICHEYGAGLVVSEMVSAKGMYYGNKNTNTLLQIAQEERPMSLQMFGSEPQLMAEMAKQIEQLPCDIIDINMGCPVPKITGNGEGSALLKRLDLIGDIVSTVSSVLTKPLTVKIRKGYEADEDVAVEAARIIEASGAAAVAVHGRTRAMYYSGQADWDCIARVKQAVKIPVIGNGDVKTPQDAERMLRETGVDAVMIGRAAQGDPFLFRRLHHYFLTGEEEAKPSLTEVLAMIRRHALALTEQKGEAVAMREMRKHVAWYTTGYPGSAGLRRAVCAVETVAQLEALLGSAKR